jgi:glycosyltransferase involved in cell wall biosynthesis
VLLPQRQALRRAWGIADDAYCVLFCGKFIAKKRPLDLIAAAQRLSGGAMPNIHLLFVGAGRMGEAMRAACDVVHDAERPTRRAESARPKATFAGFLNQTEISQAYVAADCLVLPSDHGETWGLVVNEALASGLPCIASDACGCTEDLLRPINPRLSFRLGDIGDLAGAVRFVQGAPPSSGELATAVVRHSNRVSVDTVTALMQEPSRAYR